MSVYLSIYLSIYLRIDDVRIDSSEVVCNFSRAMQDIELTVFCLS